MIKEGYVFVHNMDPNENENGRKILFPLEKKLQNIHRSNSAVMS